jgi:AraC-like DNA-binding protein/tetratricopeptide (TPR) repeat protein
MSAQEGLLANIDALPQGVRRAFDAMRSDPGGDFSLAQLAAIAGVTPRTLQRQFLSYLGKPPLAVLRDCRYEAARREFLRSSSRATVTTIASHLGFNHLGRFARQYRIRYNESPSATLKKTRACRSVNPLPLAFPAAVERPAVAVLPFDLMDDSARPAAGMAEEIIAAILRLRWIRVVDVAHARYRLRGKVRGDSRGHLRATVLLADTSDGRYIWADRWHGERGEALAFQDRVAVGVAAAIQRVIHATEIERVRRVDPVLLSAWELTMRALPQVLSAAAGEQGMALELLEEAMGLAPNDPLPMSLAAWCHGLRGSVHLAPRHEEEKRRARELAARAAALNSGDAPTEALLAAGYALANDLTLAAIHVERALAIDGGSGWAWGRGGLVSLYQGNPHEAIERLRIARALAPGDLMNSYFSAGLGTASLHEGRYLDAIRWLTRARAENPQAVWMNHLLASAYSLAGRKEDARRSLLKWTHMYPAATIADIRSGLPFPAALLDRIAEGLEGAGMHHQP